ncbi:unnamed protein product, partial [Prorocentrum cordatum]
MAAQQPCADGPEAKPLASPRSSRPDDSWIRPEGAEAAEDADASAGSGAEAAAAMSEEWAPPRLYVCSGSFPPTAKIAVRALPCRTAELLGSLPHGTRFQATGQHGDFLRFALSGGAGGRVAYVPRVLDGVELLVPGDADRAAAEEAAEAAAPSPPRTARARCARVLLEPPGCGTPPRPATAEAEAEAEAWAPPRPFGCSASFPAAARIAVRAAPSQESELLCTFPHGWRFDATGRRGEWLRLSLPSAEGPRAAWVPRALGGVELLVPCPEGKDAPPGPPAPGDEPLASTPEGSPRAEAPRASPGAAAEVEAFHTPRGRQDGAAEPPPQGGTGAEAGEFQGHAAVAPPGQAQPGAGPEVEAAARSEHQVAEFQQWWDAGHGAGAAAEHAVLGLIDVCQLAQIVSAGAGYHTILTLDRLDALQRRIASDGRAELDPLRRALQARGGAKPQARAVGSLLFREALALFLGLRQGRPGAAPGAALASSPRGPPMGQAGAAVAAGTPPRRGGDGAAAAGATSDAAGAAALDEAWEPPRPFVVCSEDGSACAARPATRASCSPACPAAPSSWRRGATGSSSLCRPSVPGASLAPPLCPWPPAAFSCWS